MNNPDTIEDVLDAYEMDKALYWDMDLPSPRQKAVAKLQRIQDEAVIAELERIIDMGGVKAFGQWTQTDIANYFVGIGKRLEALRTKEGKK